MKPTLEQQKNAALDAEIPKWPYPGGPDFRPDNADNLRGPDGIVRCEYKGSAIPRL